MSEINTTKAGFRLGKFCKLNTEYYTKPTKSGKPGKKIYTRRYWYTPLNQCDLCGMWSTPKKIHYRGDVYGWDWDKGSEYLTPSKDVLCMGCWNKVKVISKRKREAKELKKLTNKLYREALRWQKSQTQAN